MRQTTFILTLCIAPFCFAQSWTEDSFEDFADGTFDAAGQNLYVTAGGQIKTIHRFDLNGDGYIDLPINTAHDFVTVPPVTMYALGTGRSEGKASELPIYGASRVAVADLNKDGYLDAVFAPKGDWITHRRYIFILWGDERGWSARRMTNLISTLPVSLEIADLDGDGFEDIVVLNANRWALEDGKDDELLRVYWNGPESFDQTRFTDRWYSDVRTMRVADLDADGKSEVILLHNLDPQTLSIYWNDGFATDKEQDWPPPQIITLPIDKIFDVDLADVNGDGRPDLMLRGGKREVISVDPTTGKEEFRTSGLLMVPSSDAPRQWGDPVQIDAPPASHFAFADFDGDSRIDLAVADASIEEPKSVQILWGDEANFFSKQGATVLPIARSGQLAIGDLDGDGHLDLVTGVSRGEMTYSSSSVVFYGDGKRSFDKAAIEIPTTSVLDVKIVPNENDAGHRLLFCNSIWGRINEDVPVRVFWGGKDGVDGKRFSKYSIRSGHSSNAADFNNDGYVDLILSSIVHNVKEMHDGIGVNILWGAADGLKDDRRTVLKEYGMLGNNVADFNRDGYLDIVTSNTKGEEQGLVIRHGSAKGFTDDDRVLVKMESGPGHSAIGDFNRDGRLDVAASVMSNNRLMVFWGSEDGFSSERTKALPLLQCDDVRTADLDGNGWLDLIATSYKLPNTNNYDYGTFILWGSPEGYDPTRVQRLPSNAGFGIAVADFDRDSHLDLFIANYKTTLTRQAIPSYLYWGSADGFDARRRTDLTADSGTGALAADFNSDGLIDIAIAAHSLDGDHHVDSRVYYNDGNRFMNPKMTRLPSLGPHHMGHVGVGHVYDRSYRQRYESSVFQWDAPRQRGVITWDDVALAVEVRASATADKLSEQPWTSVADGRFSLRPTVRCLQYRVTFISDNGDRYATLDRVEVHLVEAE